MHDNLSYSRFQLGFTTGLKAKRFVQYIIANDVYFSVEWFCLIITNERPDPNPSFRYPKRYQLRRRDKTRDSDFGNISLSNSIMWT